MIQIMNHKWINEMDEEDKATALLTDTLPDSEFSEEVLTMMLARGIDREKTIQVLIFGLIIIPDSNGSNTTLSKILLFLRGEGGRRVFFFSP